MAPPKHFTLVSKYFLIDVCVNLDVSLLVLLSSSLSKLLKYFDAQDPASDGEQVGADEETQKTDVSEIIF